MGFAPAGIKLIIGGIIAAAGGGVLMGCCRWLGIPLLFLGIFLAGFSAYFFRDPERPKTFAAGEIACPADGTVLTVKNEGTPGITVVRIFLSIMSVHVQRSPMEGKVEGIKFTQGRFAIAYKPEAAENQRNLIRITGAGGRAVEVEQITGSIARRTACYVKEGQEVKAGERIGMIYFGSQVAVYLPESVKILVKPGDKVAGAETVLGQW
ncbi:MAG: phosphatidylserine decarboxylase family protein [Elusimicrobia bacterium CG08_land_8_20_14_0_20_59_10]|nr:MAG: phosphatidylserine decarboxylase family protein [Elusimicrobia bacterium CG08_land_8_20_14_0_20_59_10]